MSVSRSFLCLCLGALFPLLSPGQDVGLHERALVADAHNDVLSSALMRGFKFEDDLRGRAHTDLIRLRAGGVDLQVFSVWCSDKYTREGGFRVANAEIDMLEKTVARNRDRMALVRSTAELRQALSEGKLAAMIGVEGGHMIEENLDHIDSLYARGARYLTLTWNNSVSWASSAYDEVLNPSSLKKKGLNEFGIRVIRRLNQLGMMVDLSHVGEQSFWDAMQVAQKPVLLSHSSVYALCPHYRNLKDDQIRAVAANGGLICINFYSAYLDPSYNRKVKALISKYPAEADSLRQHLTSDLAIGNRLLELHPKEAESLRPPLSVLIDHIDHIVRLGGVDHVGLGSDFDGVGSLPKGLDDVSRFPEITRALQERGYSEADILKILGGNYLRVWRENESS